MKKIISFFLLFIILSSLNKDRKVKGNVMDSFQWMAGSWKMETKRGMIMETWISSNDSTLAGESIRVNLTGGTDLLEKIQLVYRNHAYYYIPVAQGQNKNKPVSFKITKFTDTGFVAENPEHDFPKRITYQLENRDSLHAVIDGGPLQPEKKSDFYYSRIKN